MYLKSLSLKGFKSFADRSVLSLEPGVTAIVGPNGSGKSNISDAVLWVLGERNAKNLRGQVMEDVIFAGSSARKSVGVAEVDLVLDNSDGSLPVDYSEVSVTRRMFRSGESEYLINGTPARRMDVLDILHDSGMGTGTYSIISQGNLDSILQSKPEDRRALIEEAAGVLKHKQRKAKSARRIEQMEQHLERVQDIVNEVGRQLGPLERKAKKAAAYQDLSSELGDLSLQLAVDDVRVLRSQWDAILQQQTQLEQEFEAGKEAIAQAEATSNSFQDLIRNGSESMAALAQKHRSVSKQVERFDSQIMLYQEKLRAARVRMAELTAALDANEQRRCELCQEEDDLRNQLAELTEKLQAAEKETTQAEAEHVARAQVLAQMERDVFDHLQARRDAEKEEQQLRHQYSRTKDKLESATNKARVMDERVSGLQERYNQASSSEREARDTAEAAETRLAGLTKANSQAKEAFEAAKKTEQQLRLDHDAAIRHERAVAAEMMALEELERQSLSTGSPARAWLDSRDKASQFDVSPLLHELKVEQGFETAVECFLGADVAALLVDQRQQLPAIQSALKQESVNGFVTLLARSFKGGAYAVCDADIPAGITPLLDHMTIPAASAQAFQQLFGKVLVCETLEQALAASELCSQAFTYVTMGGCLVFPDGRVVVGSSSDAAEGAVSRARKLDGLREKHRQAALNLDRAAASLLDAEKNTKELQDALLEVSQELALVRGQAAAARNEAASAEKRRAQAEHDLKETTAQRQDIQKTIDECKPAVDELLKNLKNATALVEREKTLVAQAQDAVAPAREEEGKFARKLADAKLAAAMLQERETYLSRMMQARQGERDKLNVSTQEAARALVVQERVESRAVPLMALMELLSANARERARKLEEASSREQDAASTMHEQAQQALAAVRQARENHEDVGNRLSEVRIQRGRLEVQVEAAVAIIAKEYALPLEKALELPVLRDRNATEEEVFRLKRRIANMGTINPDAAQEYEQLKVRYDYLTAQLSDLRTARAALRKINAVIDERMKDDFARTFEAANANFKEIFAALGRTGAY